MFAVWYFATLAGFHLAGCGLAMWAGMLSSRPAPQPTAAVTYVREGNVIRVNFRS